MFKGQKTLTALAISLLFTAPVYAADGTVDMQASRRVEIKFRLKDEEMMNQIAEMLEETK